MSTRTLSMFAAAVLAAVGVVGLVALEAPQAAAQKPIDNPETLLDEVVAAYRAAPALTDTMTFDVAAPSGSQKQINQIAFDQDDNARSVLGNRTITVFDDRIYIDNGGEKYFPVDIQGSVEETIARAQGQAAGLPPQFNLRSDDDAVAKNAIQSYVSFILVEPRLEKVELTRDEGGAETYLVTFRGANGTALTSIDAASKMLSNMKLDFSPKGQPADFKLKANISFEPKVHDKLPTPITFDAAGRRAVDSMQALVQLSEGDLAPDFTLKTLDGKPVTLSSLRGSVVVLDFWATWCGPCRKGLPSLQKFHEWAESSGQPVKVFAVDTFERFPSVEQTHQSVKRFWTQAGYTMPTLMDDDQSVVRSYGFTSIPTTVIVDPNGRVAEIHSGFDPGMTQKLQNEALELLNKRG